MEKTCEAVLSLIRAALWNEPLELPPDLDWDGVERSLRMQAVMGIVAGARLEGRIPDSVRARWDHLALRYGAHFYKLLNAQDELLEILRENDIPAVILKGTAAAVYYPDPEMRAMGDVDLLVPREQVETAANLLLANGYVQKGVGPRVIGFSKDDICFELHQRFSSPTYTASQAEFIDLMLQEEILQRDEKMCAGSGFPLLPPLANGLTLLVHAGRHIRADGIGLRHAVDWMMYVHCCLTDDYWRNEFAPAAKAVGLETLAIVMTQMCRLYLGLPDSITWCSRADAELCERLLVYILSRGNFGIQHSRDHGWVSEKITHIMHKARSLFDWLKIFQESGRRHWKAARRHKFLHPFAWAYGGYRCLRMLLEQKGAFSTLCTDRKTAQNDRRLFEALDI